MRCALNACTLAANRATRACQSTVRLARGQALLAAHFVAIMPRALPAGRWAAPYRRIAERPGAVRTGPPKHAQRFNGPALLRRAVNSAHRLLHGPFSFAGAGHGRRERLPRMREEFYGYFPLTPALSRRERGNSNTHCFAVGSVTTPGRNTPSIGAARALPIASPEPR